MQLLDDPILRDVSRVVYRSADITADFKTRLMLGLGQIDRELKDSRELLTPPEQTDAVVVSRPGRVRR